MTYVDMLDRVRSENAFMCKVSGCARRYNIRYARGFGERDRARECSGPIRISICGESSGAE